MNCCDMKGFLSYLILWCLRKKPMNGVELANELKRRKGAKPSPGTIYPALKALKTRNLIISDKNKRYSLTKKGEADLKSACGFFCKMFYDMEEMVGRCQKAQ